jgi:hypothetical protein
MGYPENKDQDLGIGDLVKDPVFPYSYTPDVLRSTKFDTTLRSRVFCQGVDTRCNAPLYLLRERSQLPGRSWCELDPVSGH